MLIRKIIISLKNNNIAIFNNKIVVTISINYTNEYIVIV